MRCAAALALAVVSLAPAAVARAESPPLVTTGTATEAGLTGAVLSGTVSSGTALSSCWFEWGIPPAFGAAATCHVVSSEGPLSRVTAPATGLEPGTGYGWRLAASNGAGVAHGETATLTTTGFPVEQQPATTTELPAATSLPEALTAAPEPQAHPRQEDGLYVAYCPGPGEPDGELSTLPRASEAMANHTGWPSVECLKMDKGSYGVPHALVGLAHVHNYLLGGYGDDTIWGGDAGDVIWGDYHPSGQRRSQYDALHGGAGEDWIYSSHGYNQIWTGGGDDHVALVYGWGTVHCNGGGLKTLVMRYLERNRHWRLVGCRRVKIVPYRA